MTSATCPLLAGGGVIANSTFPQNQICSRIVSKGAHQGELPTLEMSVPAATAPKRTFDSIRIPADLLQYQRAKQAVHEQQTHPSQQSFNDADDKDDSLEWESKSQAPICSKCGAETFASSGVCISCELKQSNTQSANNFSKNYKTR